MALVIKMPEDQATITTLMKLLVKERPVNMGAQTDTLYCMTQDGMGNLRIPVGLGKLLWNLQSPDYTTLPRKNISCNVVLGEGGRDFQIPTYTSLAEHLVQTKMAFLSLFTGAGKTQLAVKVFADLGLKTAVITHVKLILPQWVKVLKEKTNARVVEIKKPVAQLPDADIYVFMAKAASKMHPSVLSGIHLLIVDEATYFMTPERIPALLNFTPVYMLGLCAEIKRDDGMHAFLPYFFGSSVIRRISEQPFTIYRVETPYKPTIQYQRWSGKPDWNLVLESLADNESRNDDIVYLCRGLVDSKIIVGTKRKDQARYLHRKLVEAGENAALLIENTTTIPQCRILIGIYGKMGIGVDVKNLCPDWEGDVFDVAILALDLCKPEQFVGRVLGRHPNPTVYHFVDDYSTLRKHFDKHCEPWYKSRKGVIVPTIINRK